MTESLKEKYDFAISLEQCKTLIKDSNEKKGSNTARRLAGNYMSGTFIQEMKRLEENTFLQIGNR